MGYYQNPDVLQYPYGGNDKIYNSLIIINITQLPSYANFYIMNVLMVDILYLLEISYR